MEFHREKPTALWYLFVLVHAEPTLCKFWSQISEYFIWMTNFRISEQWLCSSRFIKHLTVMHFYCPSCISRSISYANTSTQARHVGQTARAAEKQLPAAVSNSDTATTMSLMLAVGLLGRLSRTHPSTAPLPPKKTTKKQKQAEFTYRCCCANRTDRGRKCVF